MDLGRYGTEDVTLEYARKRSATTRTIFQSTLAQCREILASSRTTPSKSRSVHGVNAVTPGRKTTGGLSASGSGSGSGSGSRDPLALSSSGKSMTGISSGPNPFLSPVDKDKDKSPSKHTPRTPPLSPFGRGRLDLTGLRRNTNTSESENPDKGKREEDVQQKGIVGGAGAGSGSGPISVPSPFLAMSPRASSSKPNTSTSHGNPTASSRKVVPTTPTKTRMTDKLASPSKPPASSTSTDPAPPTAVAPSPSRRGNASPMHNSLLKNNAERVRRAGFAAIDERDEHDFDDDDDEGDGTDDTDELGLGPGTPSKRRKFGGRGIDLESAIKTSGAGLLPDKREPTSPSSSKRKLHQGLRARDLSPVRPKVDLFQLVLPPHSTGSGSESNSNSKSYRVSPYVSIHHPPLTYTGVANYVLPSAQDRIFAKTVPSAEYAWGPSFIMDSKRGHGYLDRVATVDTEAAGQDQRETWKRLDMADKRRKRAEKRRKRLLRSLAKGLEWQTTETADVEAQESGAMEVDGEREGVKKRAEIPRWEREFGLQDENALIGVGSWQEAMYKVSE